MENEIKVYGKPIGYVKDGVFVKRVDGRKHFLRKPPAIALDLGSLRDARKLGAIEVRIIDTTSGIEYVAALEFIKRKGFYLERGHGEQVALPMKYWAKHDTRQLNLI